METDLESPEDMAVSLNLILKHALLKFKSNKQNGEKILFVSRLIRKRVKPQKESAGVNNESRLTRNTCKTLFRSTEVILPDFDVKQCYEYFRAVLSKVGKSKLFKIPSWIPLLAPPKIEFNLEPPTSTSGQGCAPRQS